MLSVTNANPPVATRDILGIWADVYGRELGWLTQCDESSLADGYGERSEFLVAYDPSGETSVGVVRMVKSTTDPLPVERFTSLRPWCGKDAPKIELTRLMVRGDWRKRAFPGYPFGIYRALLRSAFQWCRAREYRYIALNVRARGEPHSIIGSLDYYGFTDTRIRIPDEFDPQYPDCTPILIDVDEFFRKNSESEDPLLRYTTSLSEPSDRLIRLHS